MELELPQIKTHHTDIKTLEHLQLIITDQYGCMDSVTNPVDVNPGPIAAFTQTLGRNSYYIPRSNNYSYLWILDNWLWEFGDGNTSTNQNHTLMQHIAKCRY